MPSTEDYLAYVVDRLSDLDGLTHRKMMGEYLLYHEGTLFGGIYDDRLLLKPLARARELLPDAPLELPYEGAKPMLVANPDDPETLARVIRAMTG